MIIDVLLSAEDLDALGYSSHIAHPTTFRLQPNGTWKSFLPGPNFDMIVERPLIVATLGGRHKTQADYALGEFNIGPGQEAYDHIYNHMDRLCYHYPGATIHLIYTGLTECTLAAIFAMLARRQKFVILRFDRRVKGYIPLDIMRFTDVFEKKFTPTQ